MMILFMKGRTKKTASKETVEVVKSGISINDLPWKIKIVKPIPIKRVPIIWNNLEAPLKEKSQANIARIPSIYDSVVEFINRFIK